MQLILILLAAFGLGYWFSSSNFADRLAKAAGDATRRLRAGTKAEQTEKA